jgi:hypothetical protein
VRPALSTWTEPYVVCCFPDRADATQVGGSSFVFNYLRANLFGKVLRAVEYPDGDLRTIKIHRMKRHRLQTLIADAQPPPFPTAFVTPEDVQQIAVWTAPHFTEHVLTDADVNAIPDNAWLFWSKESSEEAPIPRKDVKLDGSHVTKSAAKPAPTLSDVFLQDRAIGIAQRIVHTSRLSRDGKPSATMAGTLPTGARLSQSQHDRLVDLAVDRDSSLVRVQGPAAPALCGRQLWRDG